MDRRVMSGAAIMLVALAAFGIWRWTSGGLAVQLQDTTTVRLPGPASWPDTTLRLRSILGDVTVVGDPEADGISAEVIRTAGGRTDAHANEVLDRTVPTLRWSEDGSTVFAETPSLPLLDTGTLTTTWRLTVPSAIAASIRTDIGVVRIEGLAGAVDVRTDVGDITVLDGAGPVTGVSDVGNVDLRTTGEATGRTDAGRVTINGVDQPARD